jgi:hypothetical protein
MACRSGVQSALNLGDGSRNSANDEFLCIDRRNHDRDRSISRCALVLENPQLEADAMADAEMTLLRYQALTVVIHAAFWAVVGWELFA